MMLRQSVETRVSPAQLAAWRSLLEIVSRKVLESNSSMHGLVQFASEQESEPRDAA